MSVQVLRTGPATDAVNVSYTTLNGTAAGGVDFKPESGTLQWAENDSTPRTITVPLSNAEPFTGTKTFHLLLSDPSAAAQIGHESNTTVLISGDAATTGGDVMLSTPAYFVDQDAGAVTITVGRLNGAKGAASVSYSTNNGTASAGSDYVPANGQLKWADGDASSKSFRIAVSDAKPFSGAKTFHVSLSGPSLASLGSPSSATVTIDGNAATTPGTLRLSAANYPVEQNAGKVTVTVDRAGAASNALSVAYATANGTAVSGTDYTASSGTLSWNAGDLTPKSFSVTISNSAPFTGNKAFAVNLSGPSGASVSNPGSATVTIAGDGSAAVGSIGLSAPTYTVSQSAGGAAVTVERAGGSSGSVSVSYATANVTAVAGKDYTAMNGTLSWGTGETAAKSFSVPISTATPFMGNKSFSVNLMNPSQGASLTATSSAGVVINGDASSAPGSFQLSAASYTVAQNAGNVSVTVNRTGGSSGAVTVAYATANGTAVAGSDYIATNGTLSWAAGDASSKTIAIGVSNTTPFTGTKGFTLALASPGDGATLTTPSSASITIDGSGAVTAPTGSGGPSAVTNLQLVNQGGPNLPLTLGASGSILTNYQKISWTAATPGASPIASYNVYRNGVLYANTTATSYADTNAPNSNVPSWSAAATVYSYNVAAVDTAGNVGPQASQSNAWGYLNGVSYWNHDDLSYSGATANYFSTAGNPQGGTTDVAATFPGMGGWLPVAGPTMAPTWDVEIGAFNYFVIDINPGNTVPSSGTVELIMQSRLPPGDEASWGNGFNVFDYGPAPKANTWATYKVPLSAYHFGTGKFTGSISGTKLTVTALTSGFVDAGGFISGPGIPAGTYIVSYSQANSVGTFTLAGPGVNSSLNVSSEAMTFQRTDFYKFGLQPQGGFNGTMYFNNFGFTVN